MRGGRRKRSGQTARRDGSDGAARGSEASAAPRDRPPWRRTTGPAASRASGGRRLRSAHVFALLPLPPEGCRPPSPRGSHAAPLQRTPWAARLARRPREQTRQPAGVKAPRGARSSRLGDVTKPCRQAQAEPL